mmetsp:Transcript_49014/g.113582  ORF Transcript_49014/g.113582 Transcript_49014/m.113582 type:complete len:353 (-) Transcript_49014:937-1995(-)
MVESVARHQHPLHSRLVTLLDHYVGICDKKQHGVVHEGDAINNADMHKVGVFHIHHDQSLDCEVDHENSLPDQHHRRRLLCSLNVVVLPRLDHSRIEKLRHKRVGTDVAKHAQRHPQKQIAPVLAQRHSHLHEADAPWVVRRRLDDCHIFVVVLGNTILADASVLGAQQALQDSQTLPHIGISPLHPDPQRRLQILQPSQQWPNLRVASGLPFHCCSTDEQRRPVVACGPCMHTSFEDRTADATALRQNLQHIRLLLENHVCGTARKQLLLLQGLHEVRLVPLNLALQRLLGSRQIFLVPLVLEVVPLYQVINHLLNPLVAGPTCDVVADAHTEELVLHVQLRLQNLFELPL